MANLLHSKGSRTQIYKTLPSNNVGNDGDIILSQIQGRGVYLCSKVNGKWHVSSKMEELRKIEKTSTKDLRTDKLRVLDDLSIGRGTTQITKDEAKFSSSLKIKEAANAISDTTAYGQLWVKTATPNELYFTTDAGNDIQLTSGTTAAFVGDITSVVAGDGLTGGGTSSDVTLNVNVDDSTIETNSDALRIKDSGVTYAKMQNVTNARMLGNNSGGAAAPSEMTQANVLSFLGVEAGATADQTKSDIDGLAITTVGTIDTGTWEGTTIAVNQGGTGATNSNSWLNSRITTNADGSLNYDATGATAVNHDSLTGFVSNEHIDWTGASAGTIHATNYTNTTYSVGDGGLTTNDFTNDDHTKLNGIAAGAEVNVQADWNEASSGSDAFIANKPTIPANYVTNDADDTMVGTLTIEKTSSVNTTSSNYGQKIDLNYTGNTNTSNVVTNYGLDIDIDFTGSNGAGSSTNSYGINIAMNAEAGSHSAASGVDNIGMKAVLTGDTETADTTQIGYDLTITGGDTTHQTGLKLKTDDGSTDIKILSSANTADYFTIATMANGATTLATVDADASSAHLILNADGNMTMYSKGDITMQAGASNAIVFEDENDDIGQFAATGLTITTISEVPSDTDKFLMSHSGVVKYVTGANLLSYVGGQPTVTAGTNCTFSGATLNVDDAFLKNNADDTTSGVLTANSFVAGNTLYANQNMQYDGDDVINFASNGVVDFPNHTYFYEKAAAAADITARGQLWVKNDTPNNLYFTDDTGQDVAITNNGSLAGGGGGGSSKYHIGFGGRGRCQYNNWYGSNTAYGFSYYFWFQSTGSASLPTVWWDDRHPNHIVPYAGTITGYTVVGNQASADTFEWALLKGTGVTHGSAGNYSLSQVGATQSAGGTANIQYKWEQTGLSVSVAKNDILMFFFRRTTDNDSTYVYNEFSYNILIEAS